MKFKVRPFDARLNDWLVDTRFIVDNDLERLTRQFFFLLPTDSTKLAYFKAIKRFFASGLPLDVAAPNDITAFHIQAHLNTIGCLRPSDPADDPHLSMRALSLAALRRFFRYLKGYNRVERNPAAEATLVLPKRRKGKTRALEMKDVWRILDVIDRSTPIGRRDAALVAVLAFTACRIGAALKLKHSGLQEPDKVAFFEKGFKEHELYMPDALKPFLQSYINDCEVRFADEPVFRTWDAAEASFTVEPLPYIDAYLLVRGYAEAAGIKGRVTPHSFRATAITELLKTGMPLPDVSRIANHARLETTQLYDRRHRLDPKDKDFMRKAYNPRR